MTGRTGTPPKAPAPARLGRPAMQRRLAFLLLAGVAVLVLSFTLAVSLGAVHIPMGTVWGVLAHAALPGLVAADWPPGHAAIGV